MSYCTHACSFKYLTIGNIVKILKNACGTLVVFGNISYNNYLTVGYYHVTYAFKNESTLYSCLNFKKFIVRNRRDIWSLSDSSWIRTHNQLVRKQTLNHLAKLAKWLNCVVSIYMYCAFDGEYLYVLCIWLYVIIMLHTRFRVNLHSIVAWMSRHSLLETGAISEV